MTLTVEEVFLVDEGNFHHGLPAVPLSVRVALSPPPANPIESAREIEATNQITTDKTSCAEKKEKRKKREMTNGTKRNGACIRFCDNQQKMSQKVQQRRQRKRKPIPPTSKPTTNTIATTKQQRG